MSGCPVHAQLNDLKLCVHMLSLSGIFLLLLLVNFENREQLSVKAYMTRKIISACLKGLSKYRRMAFFFLQYRFFVLEIMTFFYYAN